MGVRVLHPACNSGCRTRTPKAASFATDGGIELFHQSGSGSFADAQTLHIRPRCGRSPPRAGRAMRGRGAAAPLSRPPPWALPARLPVARASPYPLPGGLCAPRRRPGCRWCCELLRFRLELTVPCPCGGAGRGCCSRMAAANGTGGDWLAAIGGPAAGQQATLADLPWEQLVLLATPEAPGVPLWGLGAVFALRGCNWALHTLATAALAATVGRCQECGAVHLAWERRKMLARAYNAAVGRTNGAGGRAPRVHFGGWCGGCHREHFCCRTCQKASQWWHAPFCWGLQADGAARTLQRHWRMKVVWRRREAVLRRPRYFRRQGCVLVWQQSSAHWAAVW